MFNFFQCLYLSNHSLNCLHIWYSLIQMKCQGGNKYALSITVKFDQSTRRFGRISFARLFKLTKHITLLFYLLSPYLLSCMRSSRNVRKNMHIIKTIMKICIGAPFAVRGIPTPGGFELSFSGPMAYGRLAAKV